MIPLPSNALRLLAQRVLARLVPQAGSAHGTSDGAMTTMLIMTLADELESGVDRRMADIAQMRALFSTALEAGVGEDLVATLSPLRDRQPASFRMSDVDALHDEMANALIRLHERAEQAPSLASLNEAIWQYLHESATRHALAI
ncbi:MAG: hypothetical protein KDI19_06455 [Pseudomonadales bacterium]|nr:hypothetical protein [Pseudomonadales bacterium]